MALIDDQGIQNFGIDPVEMARRLAQRQPGALPPPAGGMPVATPPFIRGNSPGRMLGLSGGAPNGGEAPGKLATGAPEVNSWTGAGKLAQPTAPAAPAAAGMTLPPMGPAEQAAEAHRAAGAPKLHGWKNVFDTIGQIAVPDIEERIPGTPGHYYFDQARLDAQAKGEEEIRGTRDTAAKTAADTDEAGARADAARAEADRYRNLPLYTNDFEKWTHDNPDASISDYLRTVTAAKAPSNELELALRQNPNLTPQEFIQMQQGAKPAKEQIQSQLATELAKPAPDKKVVADLQNRLKTIDPMGEDRLAASADRAAAADSRAAAADQRAGRKVVMGTDSAGNPVMASEDEATKLGLTDVMDAPADTENKAFSARHFLPLADRSDPKHPGILQMIDALDRKGKLGPVASRFNDFMAGKVGAGDPDFEKLRVAMGLATTLLMNLHVGSRGGSYMMEHFQDLANAGKMDAATLRAGVQQEVDYARDRAMLPPSGEQQGPARTNSTAGNPFRH
jgi:hypothetical protein